MNAMRGPPRPDDRPRQRPGLRDRPSYARLASCAGGTEPVGTSGGCAASGGPRLHADATWREHVLTASRRGGGEAHAHTYVARLPALRAFYGLLQMPCPTLSCSVLLFPTRNGEA